jgi:carboxypeptidase Taq
MTVLESDYGKLLAKYKDMAILQSTSALVSWDMETKMPPRAIRLRSEQLAQLSQFQHRMTTDTEIGTLLGRIEESPDYESLLEVNRRNVHLIRNSYDEQTRLPEELVVETERQRTITIDAWKKAKAAKDFALFRPELEKIFGLKKRAAEILMDVKKTASPYDALIDMFEPKITADTIASVFEELRKNLVRIIERCLAASRQPDVSVLRRNTPITLQEKISSSLADFIDYDVTSTNAGGRIDETEHPFTTGYYDDVRVTTHYYENNMASSIYSVLHEGGHAKYEQGLRKDWMYQPVGAASSYGFHESQSRLVENMVGRSTEFWRYYLPKFRTLTGGIFSDVGLDDIVGAVNAVMPSKIRTEADEVTYSLHIIIRFEIERDLFGGKITVPELPEVWNEKYLEYLGQRIDNDSEGVMQDTHWAGGDFGYFPSYALGNIYGGQILSKLNRDIPDWRDSIEKGSYRNTDEWLAKNIYSLGNLYDPLDLIRIVSGDGINVGPFVEYLESKYSKLYDY